MSRINRIKALVVEDDDKWRNARAIATERLGCEVRQVDDAQLAIEFLLEYKNINVLILDWDLRGSSRALPTALGEDVLREVICHRPDLTVVIVTGAIRNPAYTDWRKKLFDIKFPSFIFLLLQIIEQYKRLLLDHYPLRHLLILTYFLNNYI